MTSNDIDFNFPINKYAKNVTKVTFFGHKRYSRGVFRRSENGRFNTASIKHRICQSIKELTRENLSSGFLTKYAQLQWLGRILEFRVDKVDFFIFL